MKIYTIYNICGIGGHDLDQLDYYIECIRNIVNQDLDDSLCAISACKNSDIVISALRSEFPNIPLNKIDDHVPISVSFNHTVKQLIKHYGPAKGYFYLDSGINLRQDTTQLSSFWEYLDTDEYGMVTIQASNDNGWDQWCGQNSSVRELIEDFVAPIGLGINLHATIFHHDIQTTYNAILPDIFASYCMESTFSFINAGINKKWIMPKKHIVYHDKGIDGASVGFPNIHPWDHVYLSNRSMVDIISDPEAYNSGFGYEECQKVLLHNPELYDGLYAKNPTRLSEFIRNNIYLNTDLLNYNSINYEFMTI